MAECKSPSNPRQPCLLILNQMAGPMTWELAEDLVQKMGPVAMLTGHPDTLSKGSRDGLALHRSFTYRRGSLAVRFFSWLCYSVHAFFWLWKWPSGTPVLLFSNPPIGLWFIRLVAALRGTPYAVMVHDIFPDVLVRKGVLGEQHPVIRFWRFLNRKGYEAASIVLTLGDYMAATVASQFDSQNREAVVETIPPWSDDSNIQPLVKSENWFARQHQQIDKLTLMYSGNMGLGHDLESMVEAATELADEKQSHFMFIGAGPKWEIVDKITKDQRLSNVTILGWQDESVLPYSLATADVGLVSLEQELSGLAIPSKAFYFLAAHVPLIAVCEEETELAAIVNHYGCGAVVPPNHPEEIVSTVRRLLSAPELIDQWRDAAGEAMKSFQRASTTTHFAEVLSRHLGTPLLSRTTLSAPAASDVVSTLH